MAKKTGTREWIRITGIAEECGDENLRQKMVTGRPFLQQRFGTIGMEHFILFKVKVENVEIKEETPEKRMALRCLLMR